MQNLLPHPDTLPSLESRKVFFYFFKLNEGEKDGRDVIEKFQELQARCLHWFHCEYTFIGKGEDQWTHAAIFEFKSLEERDRAIHRGLTSEYVEEIQAFTVKKTVPPLFILWLFKLLRPIGSFLDRQSEKPTSEEILKAFETEGGIAPTKPQIEKHLSNTRETKAYMINLLQSYPKAQYERGASGVSGATAYYRRYGLAALRSVIMTGGNLILAGRMGEPILESQAPMATQGPWEGIGIMEYPNPLKIFSLEKMPGYKKALVHRRAGLERTALIIAKKFMLD